MEQIVKGTSNYFENIENINLKDHDTVFLMLSIPPHCNYRCKKCFNSLDSKKIKKSLSLDDVLKIIKEAKELGVKSINILGEGEPLVYKNIKKIVEYIDELGMILTMATNARMLDKDMADFLYKHNVVVGISLDTLDEKEYIEYCRGNADLKEVLKNINYLRKLYSKNIYKKNGYKVYQLLIHSTIASNNYEQMEKLKDFCGDDIYFDCQLISAVGDAKKNISSFKKGKKTFKEIQKEIKPPMILSKTKDGETICGLFYYGIFIGYTGDVILDASIEESLKYLGNTKKLSLKELNDRRIKLRDIYLQGYNLSGYCPIRDKKSLNKFKKDLKDNKIKI